MTTKQVSSSATGGFFQQLPKIEPQFTFDASTSSIDDTDDVVLVRIIQQYLPKRSRTQVCQDLHNLSRRVLLPSTMNHAVDAETNTPVLRPMTTFGEVNKADALQTTAGWKALKAIGIEEGVVFKAYDETKTTYNRRIEQFAINHVWNHTATLTTCPMGMTDGAVTLISKHLGDADGDQPGRRSVMIEAYKRLISRDPTVSWTSGQWMTERTGGSDVRGTETVARRMASDEIAAENVSIGSTGAIDEPLGPWLVDGFKWFSSATDSDMAIILAQTSTGLSTFLVPMWRKVNIHSPGQGTETCLQLNGIRISRLKNKLGTKGLPTAELELKGARAWLIGQEGKGTKEISAILNLTRLGTPGSSVSYWSRGLSVCRAYSKIRKVRGQFLSENTQHTAWMATETVRYWAATSFVAFGAALLGCSEQGVDILKDTPSYPLVYNSSPEVLQALLRLLTPVMKSQVSLAAVEGMRSSMECLGGVGYCENNEDGGILNMAKLFRDSVVSTIWEGTGSVMADDVVRVIKDSRVAGGRVIEDLFNSWVLAGLSRSSARFPRECDVVKERLDAFLHLLSQAKTDINALDYHGRAFMRHLEIITSAVVLLHDAITDGDLSAGHIASRYIWSTAIAGSRLKQEPRDWKMESEIDQIIFMGRGTGKFKERL